MDEKTRAFINNYVLGNEAVPQSIVVRQVVGEREVQKVLDIHIRVPDRKPAIEQIVDVFVKNIEVLSIDVISNEVIVRGDLEIKAIYVADLPAQPVHAVEIKHYRFTQTVEIPGAMRGMDADATVTVGFVDYHVDELTRAYKYKNFSHENCDDFFDDDCEDEFEDECEEECEDKCEETATTEECAQECADECEESCAANEEVSMATRDFDVSVVLSIRVKVLTEREIILGIAQPLPEVQTLAAKKPAKKPAKAAHKPKPKQKLPHKPKG